MDKKKTEEPKVVGTVEIFMLSDGNVSVSGPLKNTALIINVFGKAMEAIANFVDKETNPIVTPASGFKV